MRNIVRYLSVFFSSVFVTLCIMACKTQTGNTPLSETEIAVDTQGIAESTLQEPVIYEEEEQPTVVTDSEPLFYAEEISNEVYERMRGQSYPEDCPIELSELKYLHLSYKDIDGSAHEGEMVCNAKIADRLIDIFRTLYENDYPIEHMSLVDDYGADDEASMSANNTSCFNFRYISGTKKISKHGEGLAVDLNPLYNPYVKEQDGSLHVEPAGGIAYTDRSGDFDYKIDENDLAYRLFTEAGFTWGGSWKSVKDYQHFEFPEQKQ